MSILKKAPVGAEVLDLVAARSARAEARAGQELPVIKLTAGYVQVKPEMDLRASEELRAGNIRLALSMLLADPEDVDILMEDGFSGDDLKAVTAFVTGEPLGESTASATLSKKIGKR